MARRQGKNGEGSPQGQAPQPTEQQDVQQTDRKPPAAEFRVGRCKVTIWENASTDNGKWFSVVPGRTYKTEGGEFRTASSFGMDDCLPIAECFRQARLWINQQYGGGWKVKQNGEMAKQIGDTANETPAPAPVEDIPF